MTTITKRACVVLVAAALVALGGCASPSPFSDWTDDDIARRIDTLSRHAPERSTGVEPALDRQQDAVPADAGPDWYVAAAVQANPEIRAARQKVERLRERVPQAGTLPDPTASFTFGDLAETAAGQVDYIVAVQQALPHPGVLDARSAVARQEVVEALHALEVLIDRVGGDVRRAYWSYRGAARESQVLQENRLLLEQIEATVRSRVRVGEAGQADLLRVSRELAAIDNQLSNLARRERTASAMLSRLLSRPPRHSWPAFTHGGWNVADLDADALRGHAARQNPAVAMRQAELATYRQRLELARLDRRPDFVVGAQFGAVGSGLAPSANGEDQIAGTVGVSIPLWSDSYDAAEREALRGMAESLARVRVAQDRVGFEVDEAVARIEAGQQTLRRLRERMMPDARQTIDVALAAYRTGDAGFIDLVDDWRALLGDQLEEARVLTELHRARADLEQALGREWPKSSSEHEASPHPPASRGGR